MRFADFAHEKERAAAAARLETFETVTDNTARFLLESISTSFTDAWLDGPFYQSPDTGPHLPSINLVFVQSREGNTVADDPSTLGGGETDKHLIYEGLSRAGADAVLAGAKTAGDGSVIFSIWHPAVVALRQALGKPRHPTQIVLSASGTLPVQQGLLFNVPEIPVVILSAGAPAKRLSNDLRSRPWLRVISTGEHMDLPLAARRLKRELGIRRISAIGGRTAATRLINAGLVTDLYLTTSGISAGAPDTPMYIGAGSFRRELAIQKRSSNGVVFEHFLLR